MCKLSTKAAFVPNVPYSIYYSCTCSVQAFWKIKRVLVPNTLSSKHFFRLGNIDRPQLSGPIIYFFK